jgi:aminoglycoside phosphotransferase (APT) family kinase protein
VCTRPDDPLLAVVSPPRVARLRELLGLGPGDPVTADFSGWSKLVLLTAELAVLFPRDHTMVEPLQREVEALAAVAPAGLPEVPAVVHVWRDVGISPYPVVALRRLRGALLERLLLELDLEDIGCVVEQLGRLAARWHAVSPAPLRDRPPRDRPHRRTLDALLGSRPAAAEASDAVTHVCRALGVDGEAREHAVAAVRRARSLAPVIAHGDVHEGQILVDPEDGLRVTGILDWQTATVDHPMSEMDFAEWGPGLWRRHRAALPALRRRWWSAYAAERGLPPGLGEAFEWVWAASHAMWRREVPGAGDPELSGSPEEAVAALRDATRALVARS